MTLTRSKPMARGAGFKAPERPARPDRSEEFASWQPKARPVAEAVIATSLEQRAPAPALAKMGETRDQAIRDSARGEECHMRLPGVCNGRTDTTVWSHWPGLDAGRGMGFKALDVAGCYCCAACHDAIDERARAPIPRVEVVLAWMHGHLRSLVTLARKGLL